MQSNWHLAQHYIIQFISAKLKKNILIFLKKVINEQIDIIYFNYLDDQTPDSLEEGCYIL